MNLRHLLLLLSLTLAVPAFAQTLLPGRYGETAFRPSARNRTFLSVHVETNGLAESSLWRLSNRITGEARSLGHGTATNKPNGVVTGRIPRRAYFRGYITETNTVRGRVMLFTPGRGSAAARRFELTYLGLPIPVTPLPRPLPPPLPRPIPWTNSVPLPPIPPPIYATNPPPPPPMIPVRVESVSVRD